MAGKNIKKHLFYLVMVLLVGLILAGCPDSTPTPPPPPIPSLSIIKLDTLMVLGLEDYHQITLRVYPVEIGYDREMIGMISGTHSTTHFRLYDDGGYGRWHDSEGYADSLSGDNIPGDGIYSRRISSRFASREGAYTFTFALGEPPPDSVRAVVHIVSNQLPVLINASFPDSVPSGSRNIAFNAEVQDADGALDVSDVRFMIVPYGRELEMNRLNDSMWVYYTTPDIAANIATGNYRTLLYARDRYLKQVNEWAQFNGPIFWLENLPPSVTWVDGPDTVWVDVNSPDSVKFHYDIYVSDDQTNDDLGALLLIMTRYDSTIYERVHFDDGLRGDSIAGDGHYYSDYSVTRNNTLGVTHTMDWIPFDRTNQRGDAFRTTLTLMPKP